MSAAAGAAAGKKVGECDKKNGGKQEEEIWVFVEVHYTDDYKPRGGDWSSTEAPKLFRSFRDASTYERKILMDWVDDKTRDFGEQRMEDFYKEHRSFQRFFDDEGLLKRGYLERVIDTESYHAIYEIQAALDQGEYVPRTYETKIVKGAFPPVPDLPVDSSSDDENDDDEPDSAGGDQDADETAEPPTKKQKVDAPSSSK